MKILQIDMFIGLVKANNMNEGSQLDVANRKFAFWNEAPTT